MLTRGACNTRSVPTTSLSPLLQRQYVARSLSTQPRGDALAHGIGSLGLGLLEQERVALRSRGLRMAQDLSNGFQREPDRRTRACRGAPQVMDSHVVERRQLADATPRLVLGSRADGQGRDPRSPTETWCVRSRRAPRLRGDRWVPLSRRSSSLGDADSTPGGRRAPSEFRLIGHFEGQRSTAWESRGRPRELSVDSGPPSGALALR